MRREPAALRGARNDCSDGGACQSLPGAIAGARLDVVLTALPRQSCPFLRRRKGALQARETPRAEVRGGVKVEHYSIFRRAATGAGAIALDPVVVARPCAACLRVNANSVKSSASGREARHERWCPGE